MTHQTPDQVLTAANIKSLLKIAVDWIILCHNVCVVEKGRWYVHVCIGKYIDFFFLPIILLTLTLYVKMKTLCGYILLIVSMYLWLFMLIVNTSSLCQQRTGNLNLSHKHLPYNWLLIYRNFDVFCDQIKLSCGVTLQWRQLLAGNRFR